MVIAVDFPFTLCVAHNWEDERGGEDSFISWRPGVDNQMYMGGMNPDGPEPQEWTVANGMGKMLLTEIARCELPKPYHSRVFYTRQWQDPDGRVFGKKHLRIVTAGRFTALCGGWSYEFEVCPGALPYDVASFKKETA